MNFAIPLSAHTFVNAAVNVVFPWSTCPIVPTFTCGFFRSNFAFAIPTPPYSVPALKFTMLFATIFGDDGFGNLLGNLVVSIEFHAVRRASLRARTKISGVPEHLHER